MIFRTLFFTLLALLMQPISADSNDCAMNLDFTKRYLASDESVRLCDAYADTVLLVVNTASYCGFTSQFAGLEALQENMVTRDSPCLVFLQTIFFRIPAQRKIFENFVT